MAKFEDTSKLNLEVVVARMDSGLQVQFNRTRVEWKGGRESRDQRSMYLFSNNNSFSDI